MSTKPLCLMDSIPLDDLIRRLEAQPSALAKEAARRLRNQNDLIHDLELLLDRIKSKTSHGATHKGARL